MANQEHLGQLKKGIDVWNVWRQQFLDIRPDLREADLSGANLGGANLGRADLSGANLSGADLSDTDLRKATLRKATFWEANLRFANLSRADLSRANLSGADLRLANLRFADLSGADLRGTNLRRADLRKADLRKATLWEANLSEANLSGADLSEADLSGADLSGAFLSGATLSEATLSGADLSRAFLSGANLSGANLSGANLIKANFSDAILSRCRIYGTSVWNVTLQGAKQDSLIITPFGEAIITVDTLEVAQFIYLLLNNVKIRDVINTLTTKAVLILGRFTTERKAVLDSIRDELRKHNYLPILFDFEKPQSRDLNETITTLARLSRFIIADLTEPASIPQELAFIVPHLPSVPVQPLLLSSQREYAMYKDLTRYPWVLPIYRYTNQESLLQSFKEKVIDPAERKAQELTQPHSTEETM